MSAIPQRVRVCFSKDGDLRFIGHLDLQRLFERALRRSGLPLRYSQGFNPKVRLNIASALPLGFSSSCELLDFWLDQTVEPKMIKESLTKALPADLKVLEVNAVPNQLSSLQANLVASEYRISFPESADLAQIHSDLQTLLTQPSIPFERRRKSINLKPTIESIRWESLPEGESLFLRMSALPQANGRPDELLELLRLDPALCQIHRTRLYFDLPDEE